MLKVLVTDTDMPSFEIEEGILRPLGAEVRLAPSSDETTLAAEASDAAAIMAGYAPVREPVVAAAARGGCRAIVRYGIGYDNVDIAAAERLGERPDVGEADAGDPPSQPEKAARSSSRRTTLCERGNGTSQRIEFLVWQGGG